MKLPVFELKINEAVTDDSEVNFIALVDEPATQKLFIAFRDEFVSPAKGEKQDEFISRCIKYMLNEGKDNEQAAAICYDMWETDKMKKEKEEKEKYAEKFKIVNEEQRIVSGPLMLAGELIYRNNEKIGEHYVKFSAETIKHIAIKFAKKKYQTNVNLMHDPAQVVKGVTMFESFIVDKTRGINPMQGFEDVPDGSWFGSFYVENQEVWNRIKSGEFRGFSVEGLFDYDNPVSYEEAMLQKIKDILFS